MEKNWEEAPPLPPISKTLATISLLKAKAQKIDELYMENGTVQVELAQFVVTKYDEARRRARNNTSIE